MHPTLLEMSFAGRDFALDAHGLFVTLGAVIGLLLTLRLARAAGLPTGPLRDFALELILVGAVGGRLLFVATHASPYVGACRAAQGFGDAFIACGRPLWVWDGGASFQGGVLVAMAWLAIRAPSFMPASPRESSATTVLALSDLFAPGLTLARMFAKVGCFLAGCCFGAPTDGYLGVRFPDESVAYQDLLDRGIISSAVDRTPPLHPVQLYEAAFDVVLCGALVWLFRAQRRPGLVVAVYLAAQVALRVALGSLSVLAH